MRLTLLSLRSDSAEIVKGLNSKDFLDKHSREHNIIIKEMGNVAEMVEGALQEMDQVVMDLQGL